MDTFESEMKPILLSIFILLFSLGIKAQTPDSLRWVERIQNKDRSWFATPIVYYTPETRWAFGAAAVGFFKFNKSDSLSPMSTTGISFAYTNNDQILFSIPFRLYFKQDMFRISGEVDFYKFPYFYAGVGNQNPPDFKENYTASFPRLSATFLQKIKKSWYTGPTIFTQNSTIYNLEKGGQLDSGQIPGSHGGVTSGMGWEILTDSRDNVYAPLKGHFYRMSVLFFDEAFLSDFSYNHFVIDLRQYINFYKTHVLAIQAYGEYNFGEVPFNRMAQLGGQRIMRGYKLGTFRDQHYSAAQIEYRSPFWGIFGLAAFAGMGVVAHEISQFEAQYIRPSYGGGIRMAFNKKERLNLRLDYARGENRDEFYFTVSEAF
ncbi:MAG: BamA/TamA family outer membrane protein [Flavobacteriales bacterium]|nr:BamA/TamA family outer membrane protein [Flavobacteriales bacterium]